MPQETKVCRKCLFEKPITEFPITDRERGYRKAICRVCESVRVRDYYATNAEYRARTKKRNAEWAKNNPEAMTRHRRTGMLRGKYNLSREQYDALVARQNGRCALCGATEHGRTGRAGRHDGSRGWQTDSWPVDHDHRDGRVRGLLCHKCNIRIGAFEGLRDEIGIEKVLEYVNQPSPVSPAPVVVLPEYVHHAVAPARTYKGSPACSVDGCDEESTAQGLCQKHYMRLRRNGAAGPAENLPHQVPGRGAAHPKAKLTEDDVRAIRASTEKGIRLAERYGVTATLISNIRQGKVWAHLA